MLSLPHDIQKNLIERCPQLNFVCKSFRLQNFTKPKDLCYPTRKNDQDNIIKKIVTIYYNHRIKINLQPGDIIILDNNRVVHGRSSFIAKYDGTDRFLVRCFATLNYEKSKYARPNDSRVISAIYS